MTILLLNCVPDTLDVEHDGDGYVITVPACECDSSSTYITLDCRLDPMPDHIAETYEFSFGFTVADLDGGVLPFTTQDRFDVERYFDGNTREYVLPTVCKAVHELVDHVQPAYIFRVTKGMELPQKALQKHFLVTEVLIYLGYHVVDMGTDGFGRTFWLMGR